MSWCCRVRGRRVRCGDRGLDRIGRQVPRPGPRLASPHPRRPRPRRPATPGSPVPHHPKPHAPTSARRPRPSLSASPDTTPTLLARTDHLTGTPLRTKPGHLPRTASRDAPGSRSLPAHTGSGHHTRTWPGSNLDLTRAGALHNPGNPNDAVDITRDDDPAPNHPHDPPPTKQPRPTPTNQLTEEIAASLDAAARHNLATKLSIIKAAADRTHRTRPGHTKLYVHLTDETLLAGRGTMRIERFGPTHTNLAELLGHDRIIIQPVIDLHDQININAYEIPPNLREPIKLTYPVEQFPYGPGETTTSTDLDHVIPYHSAGPPGQTSTTNLIPG